MIRCMEVVVASEPSIACDIVMSTISPFKSLIISSISDNDVSHEERYSCIWSIIFYCRRKKSEAAVQALKEFKFSLDQATSRAKQSIAISQSKSEIDEFLNNVCINKEWIADICPFLNRLVVFQDFVSNGMTKFCFLCRLQQCTNGTWNTKISLQ